MVQFTDRYIKALKAKEKAYTITEDSGQRGVGRFQVKIYPTGKKQFLIQYFADQRKRQLTIGNYGQCGLSLSDARLEFQRLSKEVQAGSDPKVLVERKAAAEIEHQAAVERERAMATFHTLIADYRAFILSSRKKRAALQFRWAMEKDVIPYLDSELKARDFTADMARSIVFRILARQAGHKANQVQIYLQSMIAWAITQDNSPANFGQPQRYGIEFNPIRDIPLPHSQFNRGERFLSEDELKSFWYSDKQIRNRPQHLYFKLNLALAGQRIQEVYYARWDEFDMNERVFEIPVERIKVQDRGAHIVPVSDLAFELLNELKPFASGSDYLFPHRDDLGRPATLNGLIKCLDRYSSTNNVKKFTPRDIRRTCKTLMTKAGVPIEWRDMLQQHYKRDVATTHYDRYDYLKEKREAVGIWTKYLRSVLK